MKILLGITGGIAAYKTPDLVRRLRDEGHCIKIVLTGTAKAFVTPLSLQAVAESAVYEGEADLTTSVSMTHIELARWPDVVLITPATANFIAKLAYGFADDLLSASCLASKSRIVLVPAMNQMMWLQSITQENVQKLKHRNIVFLGPGSGIQACGDTGLGRMLEPLEIVANLSLLFLNPLFQGKSVLITAGPTQEPVDPVRYLSNRSSGKMGYNLAQAAIDMGATVTLISGPVALPAPQSCRLIRVQTAAEMLQAVRKEISGQTVFISTAAVADYHSPNPSPHKIKKGQGNLTLCLEPTIDILATIAAMNPRPFIVGFAADTEHNVHLGEQKRLNKGVDLMVVNDVSNPAGGFDSDYNAVTVLTSNNQIVLERATKYNIALELLKIIADQLSC